MVAAPVSLTADWARRLGIALFEKPRDLLAAAVESVDYVFSISNLSVLPRRYWRSHRGRRSISMTARCPNW
ncbi:hypothetical protein ACFSLT_08055 [Novosphingobium resinovorum]